MKRDYFVKHKATQVIMVLVCFLAVNFAPFFSISTAHAQQTLMQEQEIKQSQQKIKKQTARVVRVGYVNVADYEEGKEGEYKRGAGYEYLQKLASLTGWKYEYVYVTFRDGLELLKKGEIDLLGNVSYMPERAKYINYASYPQGKEAYLMYTKSNEKSLNSGNLESLNGCNIGVGENTMQEKMLRKWLKDNGIEANVKTYNGYGPLMKSLDTDETDIIVCPELPAVYNYVPIINIGFSDFFFAVAKDKPELLNELNNALTEIHSTNVDYNNTLVRRYQNVMINGLCLNKRDVYWLKEHNNTIRIGYLKNNLPYSDVQDGELVGTMRLLVDVLRKEFKIKVGTIAYDNRAQAFKALQNDLVDVIGPTYTDFYLAEKSGVVLTNAFMNTTPVVIFNGQDANSSLKEIAVADSGIYSSDLLKIKYPEAKIMNFATQEDCLEAVVKGVAGSIIVPSSQLNVLRANHTMDKLSLVEVEARSEISLAVEKKNHDLTSILNKGIHRAGHSLNGAMLTMNMGGTKEQSLGQFLRRHASSATIVSLVVIIVLGLLLYHLILSRKKLRAALESAKNANKAKSDFLFNMSHDIRTPMNAIMGFTELIEKNIDNKEALTGYVEKIKTSNEFLLSLINNVLEMARIESGKEVLDEKVIGNDEFGQALCSLFEEEMAKKHITFVANPRYKHKKLIADETKLREIILNVLSNAVKYTPEGGTITMTIEELPGDKEGYCIIRNTIEDTGIGMTKEFLNHIFDEFTREHTSTTSNILGTGLGMPIVKKLVDLMHGTITVESELGKGTKFTIDIPHRIAEENDLLEAETIADLKVEDMKGKRILLAEDNDINAEIAMTILEDYGFILERAVDGVECVAMVEKAPEDYYDLILMDIQMPNMNGYKATKVIRRLPDVKKANIPIIAMTANAFEEDKMNAYEAGMNGHVAKPFKLEELLGELSKALQNK